MVNQPIIGFVAAIQSRRHNHNNEKVKLFQIELGRVALFGKLNCAYTWKFRHFFRKGQIKADNGSWEQGNIESIPHVIERSLRPIIRDNDLLDLRNAHQQSQGEEQISKIHMMCHIKEDKISQDQDNTEGSIQLGKRGTRITTIRNHIASENYNEEQTQCSFQGDSLDDCKYKALLEYSKSFVCSICKCKRPHFGWQKDFSYDELHVADMGDIGRVGSRPAALFFWIS